VRRFLRYALLFILVFAAAVFLLNTNLLAPDSDAKPLVIAHRGLGQTYHREGLTAETCTAARLHAPEHPFLENTIDGFRAAFVAGADIVEFDVHPTTDGDFVVFHDWTVDCRTEGTGVTREKSLAELRALDIGHGYTADGGETFPFRGKGVGLMPTLGEVLAAFPDRRFLINIKSDDEAEGRALAGRIGALPAGQAALIMIYGGGKAIAAYRAALPEATVLGTDGAVRCFIRYALLGWSSYVPEDCRGTLFMLPANYAPFFWGFPDRLSARLAAHGSMLVVLGDNDGSRYTTGVDDLATLDRLPARFDGAIWTNRADLIGPAVSGAPRQPPPPPPS
jgi:glycerophosphoryl diester phosphodiesterase